MIIDASIGVKWLVPEDDADKANALIGEVLLVPSLFFSEVASAMWKKARRGELAIEMIMPQLPKLGLITETIDDAGYVTRALELGRELYHPVYDCLYLAAAEALADVVITADKRFVHRLEQTRYKSLACDLADWAIG